MHKRKSIRLLGAVALLCLISLIGVGTYWWRCHTAVPSRSISYTAFMDKVDSGEIVSVSTEGDAIVAKGKSGISFTLIRPMDAELSKRLLARHIDLSAQPVKAPARWFELGMILVLTVPLLLIMKKFALVGKSKAKFVDTVRSNTSFMDVAGVEEAKEDLGEIVDFLRDPMKFTNLGGKMPTGVLLVGPPGTGKTLLARAVAGEAGVPFFSMSGSEFVEMYVGVGASRVRDLFATAKKSAPCIVFIDEVDAVGRRRDSGSTGGSDERNQTLNQLLVEMDGFDANSGVVVIAATNRPEVLDQALLRPGRFDRQVTVGAPDIKGREAVLRVHTKDVPLSAEVDLGVVARGTPGLCGADLANVVNEAAILAARKNKPAVDMADFDAARDKLLMGAEKKSMVLTEQAKVRTAYHEAGHVLAAKLVPGTDPVHKVSIIPRGRALGVTVQIPEEDVYCYTREMIDARIKVLMGGRAAEELVFMTTTTGAGNDLARATEMARNMVCEWGMSEAFGPVAFGQRDNAPGDGGPHAAYSEATAVEIDTEIRRIITGAYGNVRDLLRTNMGALERLASELVACETLENNEIDRVLASVASGGPALGAAA